MAAASEEETAVGTEAEDAAEEVCFISTWEFPADVAQRRNEAIRATCADVAYTVANVM